MNGVHRKSMDPRNFQKIVSETLLKKDKFNSRELEESELTQFVGTTLELAKKGITVLPNQLLRFAEYVEYLYLDGNKLTELPDNFFQALGHLKWLDLRNNQLTALPTLGLRNHPNLEFLLLQGNRISQLPPELGFVPNLKGLQITGNPIENVPYDVIRDGFRSVVGHLRRASSQKNIRLPNSDGICVRPSTNKDDDDKANGSNSECADENGGDGKRTDQDDDSYVPINTTNGTKKLLMRSKMCPKPKRRIILSNYHASGKMKWRLGYKRKLVTAEMIEEKARREMEIEKRREMLQKQAEKIQRMKDRELLKTWRRQTKMNAEQMKLLDNYQSYPSRNFVSDTPFDVDPEFLNMLNRIDLYRSLKEMEALQKRRRKDPRLKYGIGDLERQMKDIKRKLEGLDLNTEGGNSPRSKQRHLCSRIAQMKDIQKSLKNLQYRNLSVSGVLHGNPNL